MHQLVLGLYRLVVVGLGFFERDERNREIFPCKLILAIVTKRDRCGCKEMRE